MASVCKKHIDRWIVPVLYYSKVRGKQGIPKLPVFIFRLLERSKKTKERGITVATINDVAKRAGVSRSTVSLVLNKSPLVKEETRCLVEQVIAEMNYVPNSNARGLSARVTNNIGVIFMQDYLLGIPGKVSYDNDQHVGLCSFNISNGIMTGLQETMYGVITERFCSIAEPDELPRVIREKRVDGAIIVGVPYSDQFIDNMKKTGLPFVIAGVGSWEKTVDSIYADPGEGTEMAVRELLEAGHKKICLLNCAQRLSSHESRRQGYLRAMEAAGVEAMDGWNIYGDRNNGKDACETFQRFWEAGNRPDAIVTANGQSATGIMSYLYEIGVRIPEDISIISYEDSSICGYAAPALTSVNIRKEELGKRAAKCLIERIQNPNKEIELTVVHPYMVERDSVKER